MDDDNDGKQTRIILIDVNIRFEVTDITETSPLTPRKTKALINLKLT